MAKKKFVYCDFRPQQIKAELLARGEQLTRLIIRQLSYIGEKCVKIARELTPEEGSYDDISGNLRSSISYTIIVDGKTIQSGKTQPTEGKKGNGAEGERQAKAMIRKLTAEYTDGIVLVVFAGMHYAVYVEDVRGRDVLASSKLECERLARKLLGKLFEK